MMWMSFWIVCQSSSSGIRAASKKVICQCHGMVLMNRMMGVKKVKVAVAALTWVLVDWDLRKFVQMRNKFA